MKIIGKSRGTVWTPPMESDPEIAFEVGPLTPAIVNRIGNEFTKARLGQLGGMDIEFKTMGLIPEQAKAVVRGWTGLYMDENKTPLPYTQENAARLFDDWDDDGSMASHVVKHASRFNQIRDESLKNSEPPSATS